ncbi:hypothetical protein IY73_05695 [Lawsonella clevelandensis]|nr:hypothetical protein IY73_05695 [Lawsonella clevelandensis]
MFHNVVDRSVSVLMMTQRGHSKGGWMTLGRQVMWITTALWITAGRFKWAGERVYPFSVVTKGRR